MTATILASTPSSLAPGFKLLVAGNTQSLLLCPAVLSQSKRLERVSKKATSNNDD